MPVSLAISGVTYEYPTENDTEWGQTATDWAIAVTDALATAVSEGDLAPTTLVSILNNQSAPVNVTGLVFDKAIVRSAEIEYYVYRARGSTELVESGTIRVSYKTDADVWFVNRTAQGDNTGTSFDMTNAGQITYTSTEITTSGTYSGVMRYRARALPI